MTSLARIGVAALITGTIASAVSTAALAMLAKAEGKSDLQPTNSTSHWLHGEEAGSRQRGDAAHTLVGYSTHHASAIFWALPFEAWLAARPPRALFDLLRDAAVISAIAAIVDYGVAPKRLTPGWELALSKQSIFTAYAALAIGLAAGARVTQELQHRR